MTIEKAESLLKIYSFINDRERHILAKEIISTSPGESLDLDKLKQQGLKQYELYCTMSKLADKQVVTKVWQSHCKVCNTKLGLMHNNLYDIEEENMYCDKCHKTQPVENKLMYKIL